MKPTESSPVSSNPFTFGNAIKEPGRFYGRQAEIRQIVNRLLSSAHESTSIVGERRIGKTSLLLHLSNPQVALSLGLEADKFCMVYVDFEGLTDITPRRFWQRVLEKMAGSVCDEDMRTACSKLSQKVEFDLFDLEDLFDSISKKNLITVFLMDEFEYVTQNTHFKGDFFGGLRSLAIHHGVAMVPATRRELVDLCYSDEIKGSPFFNIFVNIVLRPFTRPEVNDLLDGYTHNGFNSKEKEFIWNLGGGYPQFLQTAGYYLLEGKLQGLTGNALETSVTGNFDQQVDPHYNYLWSHCSESEKITLLTLLTLARQKPTKKTSPDLENLSRIRVRIPQDLTTLVKRGLVLKIENSYFIFSTSFERWLGKEILATSGDEESHNTVERWLKSNNREYMNEVGKVLPFVKKKYWNLVLELFKDITLESVAVAIIETIKTLIHI
jgi:AAA+ ATPase superfamily predicted ATPase